MDPMILLIAAFGAFSAFLFANSLIPQPSLVSQRLDALAGSSNAPKLAPFARLFDDARRSKLEKTLSEAGWYEVTPAKMGLRIVGGAGIGCTLGLALMLWQHSADMVFLGLGAMLTIAGGYLPLRLLNAAVASRKTRISRALPDMLDMLATTVQAGQALNAALASSLPAINGPLRDELKAALSEIRLGRSRADALRSMADRVHQEELNTTITAIVQAERLGSNLSKVLEELSEEARARRLIRAEELAAQLPVKMVIPMALFMLPALFVMIFGAVAADYFAK